jgi:hypothetical protein
LTHWETTVENETRWTEADLRRAVRDWKVRLDGDDHASRNGEKQ